MTERKIFNKEWKQVIHFLLEKEVEEHQIKKVKIIIKYLKISINNKSINNKIINSNLNMFNNNRIISNQYNRCNINKALCLLNNINIKNKIYRLDLINNQF